MNGWGEVPVLGSVPEWPRPAEFHAPFLVSEKIDGTHAALDLTRIDAATAVPDGAITVTTGGERWMLRAASRLRWLTAERDNFGFRAWACEHAAALTRLGPGLHRGEWYGQGIQRGYALTERRWALFDAERWSAPPPGVPEVVEVVPVLARVPGPRLTEAVETASRTLKGTGSLAVFGQRAEGLVIASALAPAVRFTVLLDHASRAANVRTGCGRRREQA